MSLKVKAPASLLLLSLLLGACGQSPTKATADLGQDAPTTLSGAEGLATPGQAALPVGRDAASVRGQQLPQLGQPVPGEASVRPLALGTQTNVVGLKVLVLTAGTSDPGLDDARALLGQAGVPYDVLDVTPANNLTASSLVAADGSGKYQGVLLTTGGLAVQNAAGGWESGLTQAEWDLLWQYEREYGVRQLALYVYPSQWPEDYGLRDAGAASGANTARLAPAGSTVFTDLRSTATVPIRYSWNYPATVASVTGLTTTPLLTDAGGRVLAAQSTTADGRERLALTFAGNPYLLHSQLYGYGLLNWLTKGVYLGEYRRYLQADVDDWFLADDKWDVATGGVKGTFRLSASDALGVRDQQTTLQTRYPAASGFRFAMMFNSGGANLNAASSCSATVSSVDPLTSVSRCLANTFDWVNHTRDHVSMDFASADVARQQVSQGFNRAATLGLNVSGLSVVSGEHSGLGWYNPNGSDSAKTDFGLRASNMNYLNAAANAGVQYLASNHAVASQWDPTCAGCGIVHPLKTSLFLVPRWPTNIYYYASTPDEVVSSYNKVYGPGGTAPYWDHNLSYAEILAQETDIALNHVLSGAAFPHYLHQTNLRQYAAGRSLVFDWTDAVLNAYSSYSTLPIKTLRWNDLGLYVKRHTQFMKSGVRGSWNRTANTVTVTSPVASPVFLTGTRTGTAETYGPTVISLVSPAANTPTTYPIQK